MRGNPKTVIEKEQVYKTKKNTNGKFVARIIEKTTGKGIFRLCFGYFKF